jgi:hypothetical protein
VGRVLLIGKFGIGMNLCLLLSLVVSFMQLIQATAHAVIDVSDFLLMAVDRIADARDDVASCGSFLAHRYQGRKQRLSRSLFLKSVRFYSSFLV